MHWVISRLRRIIHREKKIEWRSYRILINTTGNRERYTVNSNRGDSRTSEEMFWDENVSWYFYLCVLSVIIKQFNWIKNCINLKINFLMLTISFEYILVIAEVWFWDFLYDCLQKGLWHQIFVYDSAEV